MYSLGEGSHFKLEIRAKKKGVFWNIACSESLPVQKILSSKKRPFSHQTGKSDKRQMKKQSIKNQGKAPWKKSELGYRNIAQKSQKWSSKL